MQNNIVTLEKSSMIKQNNCDSNLGIKNIELETENLNLIEEKKLKETKLATLQSELERYRTYQNSKTRD